MDGGWGVQAVLEGPASPAPVAGVGIFDIRMKDEGGGFVKTRVV